MNATVSARVPVEVKRQGDRILKGIGSSVTELVNAAYAYVLERGELPATAAATSALHESQTKTLAGDDARRFAGTWGERAVLEARGYGGDNFKELLEQARSEHHAGLA